MTPFVNQHSVMTMVVVVQPMIDLITLPVFAPRTITA